MADQPKIDLLKKQRSAYKGQITSFKTQITTALSVGVCESLLRRIQLAYDKYDGVQTKLEAIDDTSSTDRGLFEDDYGALEAALMNKIHDFKRLDESVSSPTFHDASTLDAGLNTSFSMGIRLPELVLPTFSGAEAEWLAFRDIFLDLIHNKNIEPTVKFLYLVSNIRAGSAYGLIENLPVTAQNYETAWKILCDRYDNEVIIQKFHMRELYNVKPTFEHSPKSLQVFVDSVSKHFNALKTLKVNVEEWHLILTHHLLQRLDNSSRIAVIKASKPTEILTVHDLIKTLRMRITIIESISASSSVVPLRLHKAQNKQGHNSISHALVSNTTSCKYCSESHYLSDCPSFTSVNVSPFRRFNFVKENRLCWNCLGERHMASNCTAQPCSRCFRKHHSLLHFTSDSGKPTMQTGHTDNSCPTTSAHSSVVCAPEGSPPKDAIFSVTDNSRLPPSPQNISRINQVLIGTALVNATINDSIVICRALLDSGSSLNFITIDACNLLKALKIPTSKSIAGIGGTESCIRHKVYLTIASRVSDYTVNLKFYVLPKITNTIPTISFEHNTSYLPCSVELADPFFYLPDRIDLLLGAEIYQELFLGSSVKLCDELPPFYSTKLGYVISGKTCFKASKVNEQSYPALCSIQSLGKQLRQFWEVETISGSSIQSLEETLCEQHFCTNVKRLPSGRFCVSLPVKPNIVNLGNSYHSAHRQFLSLERRLSSRPEIYNQYREFLTEYINLGHMLPVSTPIKGSYFLPHHCVLKEHSSTTKLRVVFNASSQTSSGLSLNDCLMVGPTVQHDLFSVTIRFRKHIVGFCGDIAKMYRQVLVTEDQQPLQQILWRNHSSDELQSFKLTTVTYGTASAPFLATRTINQLALEESTRFPAAAKVTTTDFYVDDLLTGAPTENEALILKAQLIELLYSGGFELRKFHSNVKSLASPQTPPASSTLVLGVLWNTQTDRLENDFKELLSSTTTTKRQMLSDICRLFDPLGMCAPVILTAKLFMQTIWILNEISWDDHIPEDITLKWSTFKSQLPLLAQASLPRCILVPHTNRLEVHGFSDASEKAYGCVLYTRLIDNANIIHTRLICAKSRVAPLKKLTIPRLELCAAVLLAELFQKVVPILELAIDAVFLWSDSEVSLYRIKSQPYRFNSFVANRIVKIQEMTSQTDWHYVQSSENPADCLSRGLSPSQLMNMTLWWNGPEFLRKNSNEWPPQPQGFCVNHSDSEIRKSVFPVLSQVNPTEHSIFSRYHSFVTLVRVVAFMSRFVRNARSHVMRYQHKDLELQPREVDHALLVLIKLVQQQHFSNEITTLNKTSSVSTRSSLRSLSPHLDVNGIIRVGGRLHNAELSEEQKHPILLPRNHTLSTLIVRHEHVRLLHMGPQALLYNIRQKYWIIGGRSLCRKIVNQCVRCFHVRPLIRQQFMGDLPSDRVTMSKRPFIVVGIDFCGPFLLRQSARSKLVNKSYICLYVCFTTKAIHLEIVMNSTTESFLASLRRFVARRGICTRIYSDNATNFIGARSELVDLNNLFKSQVFQTDTLKFCAANNIDWRTIPPRSPHFGGLWESAIKMAKHHLKRVVGSSILTVEEFSTLTAQIEACLNSRPLTAMSNDPSDLSALSPGHFLIGTPLTAIPEPSLLDLRSNRLSRFQSIQQSFQHFWDRWHKEYLSELQHRYKWTQQSFAIKIGALVLIHEDNTPPLKWPLGRITDVHPDKSGVVRVVSIKTANSETRRAVNRISVLPINDDN